MVISHSEDLIHFLHTQQLDAYSNQMLHRQNECRDTEYFVVVQSSVERVTFVIPTASFTCRRF